MAPVTSFTPLAPLLLLVLQLVVFPPVALESGTGTALWTTLNGTGGRKPHRSGYVTPVVGEGSTCTSQPFWRSQSKLYAGEYSHGELRYSLPCTGTEESESPSQLHDLLSSYISEPCSTQVGGARWETTLGNKHVPGLKMLGIRMPAAAVAASRPSLELPSATAAAMAFRSRSCDAGEERTICSAVA
eukprot:scaffold4735_cov403-Prasinococcus_capsulatus_cf.AAC.7